MESTSNVQKLQAVQIIPDPHELSAEDVEVLESLSQAELDCLIALRIKLGNPFLDRHASPSTQFAF